MKQILSLSGGATKFIGLVGAAQGVISAGYKPTDIIGVSSGAIASVPAAMGLWLQAANKGLHLTLDDIFSIVPVNEDGGYTWQAIYRLITGKNSLGKQRIQELVSEVISEELFSDYVLGDYPTCWAATVCMETAELVVWNLKEQSYQRYLDIVAASAAIPIATEGIVIDGYTYFDGGLREHAASSYLLSPGVNKCVTIYSRPEDPFCKSTNWNRNLLSVHKRTLDILQGELSISDAIIENLTCKAYGIELFQVYLPRVLESLYDVDKERLKKLYEISYKLGTNYAAI